MANLKFEIIGNIVMLSLKDFQKLLKRWGKEGAIIKSDRQYLKGKIS